MNIVVTGATGYVGTRLVRSLLASGHSVTALTRDRERATALLPGAQIVTANLVEPGEWCGSLAQVDAVVHLAGELIAGKRWNAARKRAIRDSRVSSTAVIVSALAELPATQRPAAFVTASAIDYYPFASRGDGDDRDVAEIDRAGDGFLADVCRDWEAEASRAEALGVRVVMMRTGIVLGPDSAVLRKMIPQFKLFVGGRLGNGQQWFSWVHVDDVVSAYKAAISDERYRGPINVVAPHFIRQRELAKALGTVLHRPAFMPTPAFIVKLAVGEMAEYALGGRKVVPRALEQHGFAFTRATVDDALRDSCGPRPALPAGT